MEFDILSAEERLNWIFKNLNSEFILSSSFGAQSAVLLHMAISIKPDLKVVLLDTQYLFPETYQFVEYLKKTLNINLHVYRDKENKEEQEYKYGQLWNKTEKELNFYNYINKIEPMERAIKELNVKTWISGIRKNQSETRKNKNFIEEKDGYKKVYPILDWNDKDIFNYLKKHNLPYHPLWEKGYISIGDTHSTKSINEISDLSMIRFNGIKRECGLHI